MSALDLILMAHRTTKFKVRGLSGITVGDDYCNDVLDQQEDNEVTVAFAEVGAACEEAAEEAEREET
jgi:hypothetical protein